MTAQTSSSQPSAPAYDILKYSRRSLDAIFEPGSVAVIGASEKQDSIGHTVLRNLIGSPFGGTVFPVNPTRRSILGLKAYPSLSDVPDPVDLAVIASPAPAVPGVLTECVRAGVKGAIVISPGFKEAGPEGIELERRVLEEARKGGIRLLGPNSLGVMRPVTGLNATAVGGIANLGSVGFISQSRALYATVLDWSKRENVGFSSFVSLGGMLDIGWGDLIYYLGDDPYTRSIVIYMETIGEARDFLSAAREVALTKPIIVIKPVRTEEAAKAAVSHTGALAESDEALGAAFSRVGVLRVDTVDELFYMAEVLSKQPVPKGPRLTIITNAGGPGVLATDTLIRGGGELASLSPDTAQALNAALPEAPSRENPIDILADATPERYAKTLEIAAKDHNTDGLLVILTPQATTDPAGTARSISAYAKVPQKPVLASWMGGEAVEEGDNALRAAGIPTFPYPDTAARMFNHLSRYSHSLRALYETPSLPADADSAVQRAKARQIIEDARAEGRTLLTEFESKQLLSTYGMPVVDTHIARSEDEAVKCAEETGYPVVLKVYSHTIAHKTDVGGVQLNLQDARAVREAYRAIASSVGENASEEQFEGVTVQPMIRWSGYELLIGSSIDDQFGPVLLFGMGGQLVEVFKDRALALPPLNTTLARRMMERTKIFTALQGVRGRKPVDIDALAGLLVKFSQLVVEQRLVKEIDINPLLASPERLLALDARVVLHDPGVREEDLPPLAIRPYPLQYVQEWTAKDGTPFLMRPVRPEDEPLMAKFHEALSAESVYMRYFEHLRLSDRITHERLLRICFIDYDREMALAALYRDPETGEQQIVGVGRLSRSHTANEAEFALLIADAFQGKGLGTAMLARLVEIGRAEKLDRIVGEILRDNYGMVRVSRNVGFNIKSQMGGGTVRAIYDLRAAS